jgi:hypothetical protein
MSLLCFFSYAIYKIYKHKRIQRIYANSERIQRIYIYIEFRFFKAVTHKLGFSYVRANIGTMDPAQLCFQTCGLVRSTKVSMSSSVLDWW